jgi:hypothetical protein
MLVVLVQCTSYIIGSTHKSIHTLHAWIAIYGRVGFWFRVSTCVVMYDRQRPNLSFSGQIGGRRCRPFIQAHSREKSGRCYSVVHKVYYCVMCMVLFIGTYTVVLYCTVYGVIQWYIYSSLLLCMVLFQWYIYSSLLLCMVLFSGTYIVVFYYVWCYSVVHIQ